MKDTVHILIYLLIIFALPLISFADDSAYFGEGTDVYPLKHFKIQLVSEKIMITDIRRVHFKGMGFREG